MMKPGIAASFLVASFLLVAGWPAVDSTARATQQCTLAGPELNAPLCALDTNSGYRVAAAPGPRADGLFLILTFSGGGTRAAAFSLGALTALRDIRLTALGNASILERVSVISSVSGGSFTSAFYGLFRDDIFPACLNDSCGNANAARPFYKRMLYRNIQKELVVRALWPPTNVMRRSEFAAKMYSSTIFDDKSFADLMTAGRPRQPFILLNSTDIGMGYRFEFSQDQFDYLCSDLSQVKLGTGVGASAAFPILLDTIPMRNYGWPSCGYKAPDWVADALAGFTANARRFEKAEYLTTYSDDVRRRYIHLLDGGLADNIGLRGPMEAIETNDFPGVGGWRLTEKMLNDEVKRVAVITVDAKTIHPQDWDCCRQPPGFFTGFDVATSIPHSRYSFETLELWREIVDRRTSALRVVGTLPAFNDVTIHFDGIPDADEKVRTYLFELPTTFSLPRPDVDLLVSWGYKLAKRSPELRMLCDQLGGCTGLEPSVPRK